jgi:mRNA interferase HigB
VRIIKPAFLVEAFTRHPTAKSALLAWRTATQHADWSQFADVRTTFGSADQVRVASGRTVVIFNIGGNNFRLICAIHYNRRVVYTLRFLSHAEYSKNNWKTDL